MPAPVQDLISAPTTTGISISLEPTYNAHQSLMLLTKEKGYNLSGLGEWVSQTRDALSPEEQDRHNFVMVGFYFAILPERNWGSYSAYIRHLEAMNPTALRDKLLDSYMRLPCNRGDKEVAAEAISVNKEAILSTVESYIEFLEERFDMDHLDVAIEKQAYTYVIDPPAMQKLIVTHLDMMWNKYLAAEWERVTPMLQDAVRACQQVDFSGKSKLEATEIITGQDLTKDCEVFEEAENLIFVPSAHMGPYTGGFKIGDVVYVTFGARLPQGAQVYAPDLSRNEILVRLSALADDTRLQILKFVSENGEQRSQEIMEHLELSQSASSRHLKQLSATGYLIERRCNGAKCYELNAERIDDTLQALGNFLLGS
jgi:DNA-binding transcriptional ArsR family regulator